MVIGYWLLVIGYWLLVIGYWLLVVSLVLIKTATINLMLILHFFLRFVQTFRRG
ncbi:MAG: D-galactonate transporter [Oscillatoriales cyanobacterium]|nr:MAG: D-galactonate transporter [Oscillatoriales cyanobacterium]TAH16165.1 MAG: D-galactonate transporter [Oscillatoriales cyanobacterium]